MKRKEKLKKKWKKNKIPRIFRETDFPGQGVFITKKFVYITNKFLYGDFVSAHWATYMHSESNERVVTFIK